MNRTTCIYCNAKAYGPGCPFSPSGIHFHAGDPTRCSWCGIKHVKGPGCPFNPHSNVHMSGIEFNSMVKESIDKGITMGYLKNMLSTPIEEMDAYKLGIINKSGKKIKEPTTLEEKNSYGCLEEYVITLKKTLGKNIDLIDNSISLKMESLVTMEDYSKLYESTLKINELFSKAGSLFHEAVSNAYQSGLSTAAIEKLIIENILEKKENN